MTDTPETFEQFCDRLSKVECKESISFGPRYAGNNRDIFEFDGHWCHYEVFDLRDYADKVWRDLPPVAACMHAVLNPPNWRWILGDLFYGKERVDKIAKHYGAVCNEDEYPREECVWFYLSFSGDDDFEKLMKVIWDLKTGEFKRLFGENAKEYESCIGYLEEDEQ